MSWNNPWAEDLLMPLEIVGKTIESSEVVNALYGTTPDAVLLLCFTDGTRTAVTLTGSAQGKVITSVTRLIDSEGMRKAPLFFTDDEVADQVKREMGEARQRKANERRRKEAEIERLRGELTRG